MEEMEEDIEEDIEEDEEDEALEEEMTEQTTVYIQKQHIINGIKLESEVDNCFGFDVSITYIL